MSGAWEPFTALGEAGYKHVGGYGGYTWLAGPGGVGLVVLAYDWPMHRVFPGPHGLRATPRPGLRLTGTHWAREPTLLRATGRARLHCGHTGACRVEAFEGLVDEWGLLDPYPREPPAAAPVLAAIQAGPSRILALAAHTRPHSALILTHLPPQPAAIVDVCTSGQPLASRAWRLAPPWLKVTCIEAEGDPDLPGARPKPGSINEAVEELQHTLKPF